MHNITYVYWKYLDRFQVKHSLLNILSPFDNNFNFTQKCFKYVNLGVCNGISHHKSEYYSMFWITCQPGWLFYKNNSNQSLNNKAFEPSRMNYFIIPMDAPHQIYQEITTVLYAEYENQIHYAFLFLFIYFYWALLYVSTQTFPNFPKFIFPKN